MVTWFDEVRFEFRFKAVVNVRVKLAAVGLRTENSFRNESSVPLHFGDRRLGRRRFPQR